MAYANLLKLFLYKKNIPYQINKFPQNTGQKLPHQKNKRLHKIFIILLIQKKIF